MKSRGRAEEATVPLDYLTALHETYEDWLIHQQNGKTLNNGRKQEVIVVNANQSKEQVFNEAHSLLTERLAKIMSENILNSNSNSCSPQKHHPCSIK